MSFLLDCLYAAAGAALLPYWLWKLPQARRYRAGLVERLGFAPSLEPLQPRLWIHCASVGEAGIPRRLVSAFQRQRPDWDIVFSTNTDTGAERLRTLYPARTVFHTPLDFACCVGRALDRVRPDLILLVELEMWPNFLLAAGARGVPVAIVSGRIGEGSRRLLRALLRFFPDLRDILQLCCARSEDDAGGFMAAGLNPETVFTCGSLKYDTLATEADPEQARHLERMFNLVGDAPVLVAGSTHDGEELLVAAAYRDLKIEFRRLRLVIAPRHIERADRVQAALEDRGFTVCRKTELEKRGEPAPENAVCLVDTIGDLVACYSLANCAFVGRSLLPPGGGQNMMEPAALGTAVLVGPHTGNFRPEMRLLERHGAVKVAQNPRRLSEEIKLLLREPERAEQMARAARRLVRQSRGATERTLARLEPLLRDVEQDKVKCGRAPRNA